MKRRTALQLGVSTLLATTAGCSFPQQSTSSSIEISYIDLRNHLNRGVEVRLLITDSDEIVLWRTRNVDPDGYVVDSVDELSAKAGKYTLYSHIPDTDTDNAVRVNLVEEAADKSCIGVGLSIRSDRQGDPSIVYGSIGECENQG